MTELGAFLDRAVAVLSRFRWLIGLALLAWVVV